MARTTTSASVVGLALVLTLTVLGGGALVASASSFYGHIYASPNPGDISESVTVSCSYYAYKNIDITNTGSCQVDGIEFYSGTQPYGSGSKTFGPGSLPAGSHTLVVYYVTGWNPFTHRPTYSSTSATLSMVNSAIVVRQFTVDDTWYYGNGQFGELKAQVTVYQLTLNKHAWAVVVKDPSSSWFTQGRGDTQSGFDTDDTGVIIKLANSANVFQTLASASVTINQGQTTLSQIELSEFVEVDHYGLNTGPISYSASGNIVWNHTTCDTGLYLWVLIEGYGGSSSQFYNHLLGVTCG